MTKLQKLEQRIAADNRIFQDIKRILEGLENGGLGEFAYPKATGAIEAILERAKFRQEALRWGK
jgi:hypothetical protein